MSADTLPFPSLATLPALRPLDQFVAQLTRAAYEAALNAGLTGPFIEAQLAIWSHIRRVVESDQSADLLPAKFSHGPASQSDCSSAQRRIVFVRSGAR